MPEYFAPNFSNLFGTVLYTKVLFVLYLLDICQIDENANFKSEFHN